jgi:ribosomal protein S20
MPELHRGAHKGAFHRNTIGRKLSGLSRRINAM